MSAVIDQPKGGVVQRLGYSPAEVAAAVGVCEGSVRRWIGKGVLKAVKVGGRVVVPSAELERVLKLVH